MRSGGFRYRWKRMPWQRNPDALYSAGYSHFLAPRKIPPWQRKRCWIRGCVRGGVNDPPPRLLLAVNARPYAAIGERISKYVRWKDNALWKTLKCSERLGIIQSERLQETTGCLKKPMRYQGGQKYFLQNQRSTHSGFHNVSIIDHGCEAAI